MLVARLLHFWPFRYGPLCRLWYYNVTVIVEQRLNF